MPGATKSETTRLLVLAAQGAALLAVWVIWTPWRLGVLGLALGYVLALWAVAAGITLWNYVAFSLAPIEELLAASVRASASAMWLVPGALLLAGRSPAMVAIGLTAVILGTRLLVLSRAPEGEAIPRKSRAAGRSEPPIFRYQPAQPAYFAPKTVPSMVGALALQIGVFALAGEYPMLAAVSFTIATAIWTAASVSRGATEARVAARAPYSAAGILLTVLLTVTLTAVLVDTEIVREGPAAPAGLFGKDDPLVRAGVLDRDQAPGVTARVLKRLAHVPPAPPKAEGKAPQKAVVARLVEPGRVVGAKGGIPGLILRPRPKPNQMPKLVLPGLRSRPAAEALSAKDPLAIPFTGEYHLYRKSSEDLPPGAMVEMGTPMENRFRTTNGGQMETLAIQRFEPPLDLMNCGKLLVAVTSVEETPVLASMQLVAEGSVEDGGTDLMGMGHAREEMLEFKVPVTARPLLVRAIRISFQHPFLNPDQNARIAVERFTLEPRER